MKKLQKNRRNQTMKADFSAGCITNYSGLKAIHAFIEKIGMRKLLHTISIDMHHNMVQKIIWNTIYFDDSF